MEHKAKWPFMKGDLIENRYWVEGVYRGNMGIVYLCVDQKTNLPIALKTFKDQYLDSEESRKRFLEEASMWIRLDHHPNLIRAYALKELHGKLHLLLERVIPNNSRGVTLKDYMFSFPLLTKEILQISIHVCDGMIHALRKFPFFVHRDLKSENILYGDDFLPKITDFGMTLRLQQDFTEESKIHNHPSRMNPYLLANKMEGTPAFASPEQCMCKPLDTRSDIYSMGCMMYHLVAKRPPFLKNEVSEYVHAHMNVLPPSPDEFNSEIPTEFAQCILQCLAKKQDQRYQNFNELRDDLIAIYQDWVGDSPVSFVEGKHLTADDYLERAKSFLLIHQLDFAEQDLSWARKLSPDRGDILLELGKIYSIKGDKKKALRYLEESVKYLSQSAAIYRSMGDIYLACEIEDQSLHFYEKAFRLNPKSLSLIKQFVSLLRKSKQPHEKILRVLDHGIEQCRDNYELMIMKAEILRERGDFSQENTLLQSALKRFPNDAELMIRLAENSLKLKNTRSSVFYADRCLQSENMSFDHLYRLGKVYQSLRLPVNTMQAWKRAAYTDHQDGTFEAELAKICYAMREINGAWQHILRAEDLGVDMTELKQKVQAERFKQLL